MFIRVDVLKLKERERQLLKELRKVRAVLDMAEQHGEEQHGDAEPHVESTPPPKTEPGAALEGPEAPKEKPKLSRDTPVRGRRKEMLLALRSGATAPMELFRGLGWVGQEYNVTLNGMERDGLVRRLPSGKLELTQAGAAQADWFNQNPNYTIRPKRTKGGGLRKVI